jgi:hypothetical protein
MNLISGIYNFCERREYTFNILPDRAGPGVSPARPRARATPHRGQPQEKRKKKKNEEEEERLQGQMGNQCGSALLFFYCWLATAFLLLLFLSSLSFKFFLSHF